MKYKVYISLLNAWMSCYRMILMIHIKRQP
jgi:hypothetical protein